MLNPFRKKTFQPGRITGVPTLMAFFAIAMIALPAAGFLVLDNFRTLRRETREIESRMIEAKKRDVRVAVENEIATINYLRTRAETRLKSTIQSRVYEAWTIAMGLYTANTGKMSDAAIKGLIRQALQEIRFNHGRGYFFATDLSGPESRFTIHPDLERKGPDPAAWATGRSVDANLRRIIRSQQEGFYHYRWIKPGVDGKNFQKISFVRHFAPFDWLIGTGEYIENVENDIQSEVRARLQNIRTANGGFFSVIKADGTVLVYGENPDMAASPENRRLVREIVVAGQAPGGGFVHHPWIRPDSDTPATKMIFATRIPGWDWILGSGLYMDDIEGGGRRQETGPGSSPVQAARIRPDSGCVGFGPGPGPRPPLRGTAEKRIRSL